MQRFRRQHLNSLSALVGLICMDLIGTVSAYSQVSTDTYSETIAGDVVVYLNSTFWRCDRVSCPAGTEQCLVTKTNSPSIRGQLIRQNICLSAENRKLIDETFTEKIKPNTKIDFKLIVTSSGSSILQGHSNSVYSSETISTNAAANAEIINKNIARALKQAGEAVRKSIQEAQKEIVEAFGNVGFWR
ncbi:uncharacterized protein LOC101452210 [Ceratitis capitata]|uniref:uncharacterized protein LOC101452210 n=1 Tax=Ceratitis capitata TaxID=7213 RepID=UPI000329A19A|nr:uncharacterized protein LOC101452210 [Ceratitis capitata]